jgi:hypothetical protein
MDPRSAPRQDDEPAGEEPTAPGDAADSEDGVDLTLIRWMLGLTCTERLQAAQDMADTIAKLREGRER